MDIALQILVDAQGLWADGDIFAVYPAEMIGSRKDDVYTPNDVISSPRMAFVFAIDAPETDIQALRTAVEEAPEGARARDWCLSLSTEQWSALREARHLTLPHRALSIIDKLSDRKLL